MNICILDGDPGTEGDKLQESIALLEAAYRHRGHAVEVMRLRSMKLQHCIGCWTCWWETPGRCIHHDEGEKVFRAVINSDFFIFASPLIAGFTSALLKTITDRLIVLVHPYITIREGELHHIRRYEHYPDFGLLLAREESTDEEDILITTGMYRRFGINFHCRLCFMAIAGEFSPNHILHATHHF